MERAVGKDSVERTRLHLREKREMLLSFTLLRVLR